jgi:hypothetical protein
MKIFKIIEIILNIILYFILYTMSDSELKDKINELTRENQMLKENIQNLHNLLGYEICEYFNKTCSLKQTTQKYYFENVKHCYETLIEFNDDSYLMKKATDFKECYKEIFGRDYKRK